jgi:hypothetical protein
VPFDGLPYFFPNNYLILHPRPPASPTHSPSTYMDMKCNKIKIKIDINNDKLLKTIWENTKKIKMRREVRRILLNR